MNQSEHNPYRDGVPDSQTVRVTPAMEADLTNHTWDLAKLLA
jgi:hypothetical protein